MAQDVDETLDDMVKRINVIVVDDELGVQLQELRQINILFSEDLCVRLSPLEKLGEDQS